MNAPFKPVITVFHCINSMDETVDFTEIEDGGVDLKFISMACSSMVKDIFLLKAFENGSDAVIVFVCPEGHCRYVEGNIRAKKRVIWVKNLLDEIGIGGERLSLFNVSGKDSDGILRAITDTHAILRAMGPNPAA
jgi:F420-non-reducing hydrogenase iron-sulfur subunit